MMSTLSPRDYEGVSSPTMLAGRADTQPVLQSVRADGTVLGLLFEMSVEQTYVNPGSANIEVAYSFPLPCDAVLLGMEFELGARTLYGRIVARADAEEQYETALESGDTAIMLERATDGVYTANVGNLLAHETAVVRLRYAQLLSFRQGQVRITVPNVIAPRFGDPAAARLRLHQVPLHDMRATHPFSLSVRLHGPVAGGRISSPSHVLAVRHVGAHFDVTLAHPGTAMLDRDFVLLSDDLVGTSIATVGRDGTGYVALASFCPASESKRPALPLNLKILVDCSGSMNGDSIKGARKALHEILAHLNPADRFSYSRFGSEVAHHSTTLISATPRAILEGSSWIAQTSANMGGTEVRQALLSTLALGQPVRADLLLITDGHVWDTDPLVASAAKSGQRIFAVGVGAAPAASLLSRLASSTGGSCELVGANDDVHAAVLRMFKRMRQAPVSDVSVVWDGQCQWQSDPGRVVFTGETVHAFAGFEEAPPTSALIAWNDGDGNACQQAMPLHECMVEGDTLARVAAATRLRALPAEEQHALALQYDLVTDTTSLLIVHERAGDQRAATLPVLRVVPQMWVAGRSGLGSVPGMHSPAIWRREGAAEQIQAMMRSGVETYDTTAFLLNHGGTVPYLYREQLRVFLRSHAGVLEGGACPVTFAEVADALPGAVLGQLHDIAELGFAPQDVLRRFIEALHACFYRGSFLTRLLKRVGKLGSSPTRIDTLGLRVTEVAKSAFEARHASIEIYDIPAFLRKQAD
jgi:Ca-activated chloride channel family protein